MKNYKAESLPTLTTITPTLCALMGIEPPSISTKQTLNKIISIAKERLSSSNLEKTLIYAPDAIGAAFLDDHDELAKKIKKIAPYKIEVCSVFPPKTPICFASMFTGAQPDVHGITAYERPVLECETIFDVLIHTRKKVAIVAVKDSSIDLIFKGREMDYYSEYYDPQVTVRAIELIKSDIYYFIVVYNQEYDDMLHKTTPSSPQCINATKHYIESFELLKQAIDNYWQKYNRMIAFTPDHGAHIDPETGKGTHGLNIPQDMRVYHFFDFSRGFNK
jgi:predicted AlkP superfamily pyrophosphatase or phosphodiesterase